MNLMDVVNRPATPGPWAEGDNIPWNDPTFSARMLPEHLSQAHDAASRRMDKIECHVDWIQRQVLSARPTRILDLGCGPGLYTSRLARLGHTCVGIDYSPASIAYATDRAGREHLNCTYLQEDIREADYGSGFGLTMLIFGEFNIFRPADARRILVKAHRALDAGGQLLLEPHTFQAVQEIGAQGRTWESVERGLFSDQPYLYLKESIWDAETHTTTTRYFIVEAAGAQVAAYAQTFQAYSNAEYRELLVECGFERVQFLPALCWVEDASSKGLIAILAEKGTG